MVNSNCVATPADHTGYEDQFNAGYFRTCDAGFFTDGTPAAAAYDAGLEAWLALCPRKVKVGELVEGRLLPSSTCMREMGFVSHRSKDKPGSFWIELGSQMVLRASSELRVAQ